MSFYGMEKDTIDVVFIGTSVTFSSFMPMEAWKEYGIASCNYCTNVQFENSLRYSIREVEKTQKPQLIMIDIAPFYYGHYAGVDEWDGETRERNIKFNLDSMKYSYNRVKLTQEINKDIGGNLYSYLYYFFDIFRYHTNKPSLQQYHNTIHDPGKGYGYLKRTYGAVNLCDLIKDDGSEMLLDDHQQKYLLQLLNEVDRLECDVVFFCAPVLFTNSDYIKRKNYIGRVINEAGYPFWDLSKDAQSLGLDYNTDFWSCDHFDCLGAEKTTSYIARKIKENYNIPDRREDPAYNSWHDDYQEWIHIKGTYRDSDFGFTEAKTFDSFFTLLGEIKYNAIIEILNSDIIKSLEISQLEKMGISREQISEETDFILINNGQEATALSNFHTTENTYETVLGELNIFYNSTGEYGIYLNGEECIVSSSTDPDLDIRIRVFKGNSLENTIYFSSIKLGQNENPLAIDKCYRIQ